MRTVGFVVFVVGIAVASCFAARAVDPEPPAPGDQVRGVDRLRAWWHVAGWPFMGGMVLVVAGGVIARRRDTSAPRAASVTGGSEHRSPEAVLEQILAVLADLPVDAVQPSSERIHTALDDVLETEVPEFLDHREALIERMGLAGFATMIGHFAGLERNVGRAWSALTDEAYAEVAPCIARARQAGDLALAELRGSDGSVASTEHESDEKSPSPVEDGA